MDRLGQLEMWSRFTVLLECCYTHHTVVGIREIKTLPACLACHGDAGSYQELMEWN
jgi:hypothetical protein